MTDEIARRCVEACKTFYKGWECNGRPGAPNAGECFDAGAAAIAAERKWRAEQLPGSTEWRVLAGGVRRAIYGSGCYLTEPQARAIADALNALEASGRDADAPRA